MTDYIYKKHIHRNKTIKRCMVRASFLAMHSALKRGEIKQSEIWISALGNKKIDNELELR